MGRKMSLAREIRINRLQNKNRMTGQTFNTSGITSEQIVQRERTWVKEMQSKSQEELQAYRNNMEEMQKGWNHSYPWEWCAFERNFYVDSNGNIH